MAASFFWSDNTSTTLSRRPFGSSSSTGARSSAVPSHPEPLREDSIRNRENLLVSNREIRQLFDTIKELGDIVKRQNAKLYSLSVELENACKEVAEVKTELLVYDTSSIANLSRLRRRISFVGLFQSNKRFVQIFVPAL